MRFLQSDLMAPILDIGIITNLVIDVYIFFCQFDLKFKKINKFSLNFYTFT